MADLLVRSSTLEGAVNDLTAVIDEFSNAEEFSNQLAEAVGHDQLKDTVRNFGDGWNKKRTEMVELSTGVRDSIRSINDAFTQADADLATALDEPAGN
jgi:uncharacterized protein YukE